MKMKKMIYLMFALLFLGATNTKAQVVIGTIDPDPNAPELNPRSGAILDLGQVTGNNLGLLLPKVMLQSDKSWAPVEGGEEDEVDGMMVFNESASTDDGLAGKGVYIWISGSWSKMGTSTGVKDDTAAKEAGLTWSLSGVSCYDVREGNPFPETSDYTVTVDGGADIAAISWSISETKEVQSAAATQGKPTATLHFKSRADVSALAPAEITVTAVITLTKDGTTYKVNSAVTVKFQNASCCEGAVIVDGAYANVDATTGFDGSFSAGWQGTFTNPIGNLCWNKSDVGDRTWERANAACTGDWRLPNLKELQVLYEALGGTGSGSNGTNFSMLQSPNENPGDADNMSEYRYWSSTWRNGFDVYYFVFYTSFASGLRYYDGGIGSYVNMARCVRTLPKI